MALCPVGIPTYALSDYQNAAYPGGIIALISPSAQRDSTTRRLSDEACQTIQNAINVSDTKTFATNVTSEYCYFNGLFASAMQTYVAASTTPNVTENQVNIYRNAAYNLFGKLVDICTVIIYINAKIPNNTDIASINTKIQATLTDVEDKLNIVSQSATASTTGTNAVLYQEMEKYSRQKAAYTNNLLGLYSFLNITALGLLFYIYRAM